MFGALGTALAPLALGHLIDAGILARDRNVARNSILGYFALDLVRICAVLTQGYVFGRLGHVLVYRLRQRVFRHLQTVTLEQFQSVAEGRLTTRLTHDLSNVSEMVSAGMVTLVANWVTLAVILISLTLLSWKLTVSCLIAIPILVQIMVRWSGTLKSAYQDSREQLAILNAQLQEWIQGVRTLILADRRNQTVDSLKAQTQTYAKAQLRSVHVFSLFQPTITFFSGLSMAIAISGVMPAGIAVGSAVTFFSYILALYFPIRELADKWNLFLSGKTSLDRVMDLLDWPSEQQLTSGKRPPSLFPIELDEVHYRYGTGDFAIKGISARIENGNRVGLIGATGSGKSTLSSLLLRFREPSSGEIRMGGVPIREWDLRDLRKRVGWLQQDVALYSGSIRDNIEMWSPEECRHSAETAIGLWKDYVAKQGGDLSRWNWLSLTTEIRERGQGLSAGQRQVVALLRAWVRCPELWLWDEATSQVDMETERLLLGFLEVTAPPEGWIAIAHRWDTLAHFDRIWVLFEGTLVSEISPQQLSSSEKWMSHANVS